MNRRMWTGILAGLLAASVLLGVAGAAYNAGQRREVVTRAVGDGEVVRVVGGYGWGGPGWGHGPGFFLFPLLFTALLVFLLVRAFGGGWGRPRGHGGGYGGYGGGYGGCGPRGDTRPREEPAEA